MKEKKVKSDLATAGHYFALSIILVIAFTIIPTFILAFVSLPYINMVLLLIGFLALWFGVKYSAKETVANYVIKDANKIIKLSTILAVILIILNLIQVISKVFLSGMNFSEILPTTIFSAALNIIIFYLASKRYLKNNS